jgi:hypothetical protein
MGNGIITGLKRLILVAAAGAIFCFAGNAPAYAGVPGDDAVLLDPFDPVPQIGFRHGECDDPCGYHHRCWHECGYRHRRCERDCCGRDCDFYAERRAEWARYWQQANTYDMIMAIYMDQLRWYQWRYRDGGHGEFRHQDFDIPHDGHDGDWHDGDHHDADHHDGDHHDGRWQDGDGNWHDGDRRDGDWRDGDRHDGDGDHHDGDWHDGDHHDGDHHDGDHHDGDHHDGEWQDGDGNWHDGPPPDGYGH